MRVYGEVNAGYGTKVKVQTSTGVTYPAVWLWTRNAPSGTVKGASHLTVAQAVELRDTLDIFIKENRG